MLFQSQAKIGRSSIVCAGQIQEEIPAEYQLDAIADTV